MNLTLALLSTIAAYVVVYPIVKRVMERIGL